MLAKEITAAGADKMIIALPQGKTVIELLTELQSGSYLNAFKGGKLLLITGVMPLPLAIFLAKKLGNLYSNVAVFVPALGGYVVCTQTGAGHQIGDLISE